MSIHRIPPSLRFIVLAALAWGSPGHFAWAWGPHSEITQAAIDVLPADDPLRSQLGDQIGRLRDYCWLGDMRRSLHREANVWFYADDYLLFPTMTWHRDHLCPEVKTTYEPCFRQAVAALRSETPANAVRWIGAILHFVEDTGSPPHSAEIRGDVHSKMENWVDAAAITISDYTPQSFGQTDDSAVDGFLHRMDRLIEFSKLRAERAKPFVLAGDRPSTEPIVLESALETSRVVADLLHTLGQLAAIGPTGATLRGKIVSAAPAGLERLPAKIMLLKTHYAALADADGNYEFRNLPAGPQMLSVIRSGCADAVVTVTLANDRETIQDITLADDAVAGNLLRNASLESVWLDTEIPDGWYPVHRRDEHYWESDLLPLRVAEDYQLQVSWQPEAAGKVVVRMFPGSGVNVPGTDSPPLAAGETKQTISIPEGTTCGRILIFVKDSPASICKHVALSLSR
jgi:hypothetical protein